MPDSKSLKEKMSEFKSELEEFLEETEEEINDLEEEVFGLETERDNLLEEALSDEGKKAVQEAIDVIEDLISFQENYRYHIETRKQSKEEAMTVLENEFNRLLERAETLYRSRELQSI